MTAYQFSQPWLSKADDPKEKSSSMEWAHLRKYLQGLDDGSISLFNLHALNATIDSFTAGGVGNTSFLTNILMNGNRITGLGAGISAGDALRYEQVIGLYLLLTGGTMSGAIAMGSNKITGLTSGSTSGDALSWGQAFTSGTITFSPTTSGIKGTTTNDNATSGNVGEYISASASNQTFGTSDTYSDGASISLTAGDWDVSASVFWATSGGTSWLYQDLGISSHSGSSTTGLTLGDTLAENDLGVSATNPNEVSLSIPNVRASLSTTTIYYLKVNAFWTVSAPHYYCRISARRVR